MNLERSEDSGSVEGGIRGRNYFHDNYWKSATYVEFAGVISSNIWRPVKGKGHMKQCGCL